MIFTRPADVSRVARNAATGDNSMYCMIPDPFPSSAFGKGSATPDYISAGVLCSTERLVGHCSSRFTSRLSVVPVNSIIRGGVWGRSSPPPPPVFGNDHQTYLRRLGHYSAGLGHYLAGQAKRASQEHITATSMFFLQLIVFYLLNIANIVYSVSFKGLFSSSVFFNEPELIEKSALILRV